MKKNRLVIVDDHYDVLELLKHNFVKEGYEVKFFFTAVDALKYITNQNTDLVITDWMLPEMDGLELCKNLKLSPATRDIPIVMLTGKNEEIDVVTALEVGADDYLVKPLRTREMLTRVKKILKRPVFQEPAPVFHQDQPYLELGVLKIDHISYKISLSGILLDLTIVEFKLMELLAKHPGKVFSRNQLIEKINGPQYFATERSTDVQIVGLRKKLGLYKDAIETVRSVGYRLNSSKLTQAILTTAFGLIIA